MGVQPGEDLLSAALKLPTGARARLAHQLLASLDEPVESDDREAVRESAVVLAELQSRDQRSISGAVALALDVIDDWLDAGRLGDIESLLEEASGVRLSR